MYQVEEIPDIDVVFRTIPKHMFSKSIPNASMFVPDADGLSVDWNHYSSPNETLIRKGLQHKKDGTFKDPNQFLIVELKVQQVRQIAEELNILHSPIFNGDPAPIGSPNNQSHSSIVGYSPQDEEIRLKLRDIAREVEGVDYGQVMQQVIERRGQ